MVKDPRTEARQDRKNRKILDLIRTKSILNKNGSLRIKKSPHLAVRGSLMMVFGVKKLKKCTPPGAWHMLLSQDKSYRVMCISSGKFMMHVIIVSSHRQLIAHLKHISIITYLAANRKARRKLDQIKKRKMRKSTICFFQKFYFRCISENIKQNMLYDFQDFDLEFRFLTPVLMKLKYIFK